MSPANLLELDQVHVIHRIRSISVFGHDNVYALTDANLVVNPGETIGIVGESGCGKSTLARVIVGLQPPTSGEVRYNGTSLWSMSAAERARTFGRALPRSCST